MSRPFIEESKTRTLRVRAGVIPGSTVFIAEEDINDLRYTAATTILLGESKEFDRVAVAHTITALQHKLDRAIHADYLVLQGAAIG